MSVSREPLAVGVDDTRRWWVVVDDTPVNPDQPLDAREATREFLRFIEDDTPSQSVELWQCTEEDLASARMRR